MNKRKLLTMGISAIISVVSVSFLRREARKEGYADGFIDGAIMNMVINELETEQQPKRKVCKGFLRLFKS